MTWDYDEVVESIYHDEGMEEDDEDLFENWKDQYANEEVLDYARQRASDDHQWFGDPKFHELSAEVRGENWWKLDAAEIYTTITRSSWCEEGVDISEIVFLPYIEWELLLTRGRTRSA
jgi:hypothetical protein